MGVRLGVLLRIRLGFKLGFLSLLAVRAVVLRIMVLFCVYLAGLPGIEKYCLYRCNSLNTGSSIPNLSME